jgi:MoaD family protein
MYRKGVEVKITVSYTGQIKSAVGVPSEQVDLTVSSTLIELIRRLAERHSKAALHLLTEDGNVQRALLLVLNNEQVFPGNDPQLTEGDQVTIMPPISGG